MIYNMRVSATDWCGYESDYEIEAENEDQAAEMAEAEFFTEWDLIQHESGGWGESEDFDDEGEPLEEDSLTGITVNNVGDS